MKWDNLPEGWKVKVVTRVAQLNPIDKLPNSWNDRTEVAYIPMENVEDGTGHVKEVSIRPLKDVVSGKTRFRQQDTLFAKITPCLEHKKIAFVESIPTEVGFGSTEFYVLRPNESVVPKYLFYVLQSDNVVTHAVSSMTGTSGRKRVPSHAMRSMVIPLPPPEEQRRVAEILELADELRHKRKVANQLIDKIIRSLFFDMFGDPTTNTMGWGRQGLQDVCEFETKQMVPEPGEEYFYIGLEDIESNSGQVLKSSTTVGTRLLSTKHAFDKHHVLYGKLRPYLNKVALPARKGICSTDIVPLGPKDDALIREYLAYYLRHPSFVKWATDSSTGTKMPRLQTTLLKCHMLPIPALPLQQRFAELVSQFEEKRKQMEQAAEEVERLCQSLLKRAFSGELTKQWREAHQIRWELPQLTERQKILLAVLYSYNTIRKASPPITMLMKYMFLLQQEKCLELEYAFVPYKFGPFSKEVYEDVEALEKEMLVVHPKKSKNIEKQETALDEDASDDIEAILATLPEDNKKAVGELIEKYGSMGFRELMDYVYTKYPEFATESRRGKERG